MWWLLPIAVAAVRPEALAPRDGCELYVGNASGNDPSVLVEMRLCPADAGGVTGTTQWSSTLSGWSSRETRGYWSGADLVLSDVRLVEDRPEPGWRFCTIDRYELRLDGTYLDGTYHSAACEDEAVLHLVRVGDPADPGTPPGAPPAAPQDRPGIASRPELVVGICAGTGCDTPHAGGLAWLLALVWVRRRT